MRYFVSIGGQETVVDVSELPGGSFDVKLAGADSADSTGRTISAEVFAGAPNETLCVDGQVFDLVLDGDMPTLKVFSNGKRVDVGIESARMRAAASVRGGGAGAGTGVIRSPMPGKVVKMLVSEGDAVEAGTPLAVVEAMKMENELVAEGPGTVKKIHAAAGDAVEGGAKLITIG